jgi:membrane protein
MAGINIAYGLKNNRKFFERYSIIFLFVIIVYIMLVITFASVIIGKNVFVAVMSFFNVPLSTIYIWQHVRILILFISTFLSVTALYYISPCIRLKLKDVLIGSAFSSVLLFVVSMIFSYYAENLANYSILYGSIAVVMMLLYWLFLTAVILLMGAELNGIIYSMKYDKNK